MAPDLRWFHPRSFHSVPHTVLWMAQMWRHGGLSAFFDFPTEWCKFHDQPAIWGCVFCLHLHDVMYIYIYTYIYIADGLLFVVESSNQCDITGCQKMSNARC